MHSNPPPGTILLTYVGYAVLYVYGHLRDFLRWLHHKVLGSDLYDGNFYTRNLCVIFFFFFLKFRFL
jgi:hypothetical protein